MKTRPLGAVALLGLALATAAVAQEEAVQLRYRFQPGQEIHYKLTMTGDMGMTMGGAALPQGAPGRIPITLNGTYGWVQKVKSVNPDGSAVVGLGIDKMDLTSGVMGINIQVRLGADGKMQTLMNGQEMQLPPGLTPQPLPKSFYEPTITPSGKITGLSGDSMKVMSQLFGGQNVAGLFNGMPGAAIMFPEQPCKIGETWANKWDMKVPIPMPGPGGAMGGAGVSATMAVTYSVQNKLVKVEDGHAVIETQMKSVTPTGFKLPLPQGQNMPPGMSVRFEKMDQSVGGTYRFNLSEGTMEGSDLDVKLSMKMAMSAPQPVATLEPTDTFVQTIAARAKRSTRSAPRRPASPNRTAPHAAPGAGSITMSMEGTMKLTMERVETPTAPAPQ